MEHIVEKTTDTTKWFGNLIDSLKQDWKMFEMGIAPEEKARFFNAAINNDMDELSKLSLAQSSRHFITRILISYIEEMNERKCQPLNIAFDLNDSEVLVWAVINDDDDVMEDMLWLSEAKVNSMFYDSGFNISTTIIEKSDNINLPPHYKTVN